MLEYLNCGPFLADLKRLKSIRLEPDRHTAPDAYIHTEWVVHVLRELAALNDLSQEDRTTLINLGWTHDIGKIRGENWTELSVEILKDYGEDDEAFLSLVKYHDISLPWYKADQQDESPGDKAWRKLNRRCNVRLLCIFMIADRIDSPRGWHEDPPTLWFLENAHSRNLVDLADLRWPPISGGTPERIRAWRDQTGTYDQSQID